MQFVLSAVLFATLSTSAALAQQYPFPLGPDPRLTPGALCDRPDELRYPEGIKYCERRVKTEKKDDIIEKYDTLLGFRIRSMNREEFKIDHFIPLCAGGSNARENLWPQHISIFERTDELEKLICTKMEEGRLKQAEAIHLIRRAKTDLRLVPAVINLVRQR